MYREKVILQKKVKSNNDDKFGKSKEWKDMAVLSCRKVNIDTNLEAKFQQMGYDNISMMFEFPAKLDIPLENYRFKQNNRKYEIVKPPLITGELKQITRIAVKEV